MSRLGKRLADMDNKSFRDQRQIQELKKKLDEQKEALKQLVTLVKESKTESYKPRFNKMPKFEQDQFTLELLEEVKTLRRQVNNIENGPKANQVQNPFIIPQYLPVPHQAQIQQMMPPYMYMNPYFHMPQPLMYQQSQNHQAPKKKADPYKKLVLKILQKGEQESHRSRKDSIYSDYSEDQNDRQATIRSRSQRDKSKDQARDLPQQNKTSKGSLHDSYVSKFTRSSVKIRSKKPREFTEEQKLQLRRKLCGAFWFIRIGLGLQKYLRRVWVDRRQQYYENEAQKLIEKFDHEFNHKEVFILFVVECNKNRYFSKNWNIFDNKDIELKSTIVFQILKVLFKKMSFLTKNSLSDEHKQFVKKISSYGGFLLPGHPKFVSDRVQLKPSLTIGAINTEVSKMIQMDYVYIQVIVQRVLLIHEWYSQFIKIPNHKEAIKILVSVLHQLYIDRFSYLKVYDNSDAIYNKQQVVYCDFTQQNYVDVAITIDEQHEKYEPTTNCCILGLATQEEMQQLYDQPGYKELQTMFKDHCDYFYSQINF